MRNFKQRRPGEGEINEIHTKNAKNMGQCDFFFFKSKSISEITDLPKKYVFVLKYTNNRNMKIFDLGFDAES